MIRRHFTGLVAAIGSLFGGGGGPKGKVRAPKSQAWTEPNPSRGRSHRRHTRPRNWWEKRKSRMRMAKESRRRNRR